MADSEESRTIDFSPSANIDLLNTPQRMSKETRAIIDEGSQHNRDLSDMVIHKKKKTTDIEQSNSSQEFKE